MPDFKDPVYTSRLSRDWKLFKVYEDEVGAERRIKANAAEINQIMDNAIEKMSEAQHSSNFAYIDTHRLDDYINDLIDIREKVNELAPKVKRGEEDNPHCHKNVDKVIADDLIKAKEAEKRLLKLISS